MRRWLVVWIALLAGACEPQRDDKRDNIDAVARDYVQLSLTIGEKEQGYIDAYFGPKEFTAQAKAEAPGLSLAQLAARTDQLLNRARNLEQSSDTTARRRARFLVSQLTAAATRLRMLRGETLPFEDEAEGLFGVRPTMVKLEELDPVLKSVDALVPGTGPLSARVESFSKQFEIPKDRLKPAIEATIAECKRRTLEHIALPPNERFDMAFVTGKSWGGYNYYQGDAHSRIEINTDLPTKVAYAVDLGCHEGYPGHHVLNTLVEQRLVKERGWIEYSVYPLYSPQSLIGEGSANYGVKLAFPNDEQIAFEKRVLFPLAGVPAAKAEPYARLAKAMEKLGTARFAIAKKLIEKEIDDAEAIRLLQHYELVSADGARKWVEFSKQYRSYVINYGVGTEMVGSYVEAAGRSPGARWKRFEQMLTEPIIPADLKGGDPKAR